MKEIILARHLVAQIVSRDFTVRYRKTFLGLLWAILNPLFGLSLYWVVFGYLFNAVNSTSGHSYILMLMLGIIYWNFFSACVTGVSDSLANNLHLMKKVYFPRIVFGLASIIISGVDFIIGFAIFLLIAVIIDAHSLSWSFMVSVLVCTILLGLLALGLGCVFAIMKAWFRDFRHLMPLLMQFLFYASGIVWLPEALSPRWRPWLLLNPVATLINCTRYALLHQADFISFLTAGLMSLFIFLLGFKIFNIFSPRVVDLE